jgi:dTDP-glucose pyrophosphorylase
MGNDFDKLLIAKDVSVKQAMKCMSEIGQKELFVAENYKLLGSLSDGDIRKWILAGGELDRKVFEVCNKNPRYVEENYSKEAVKKIMLELLIESVPVVGEDGNIKEILTWDGIFAGKALKHKGKLDLKVVIMAGGKGTRLDPFTKILPKPLIPIGEKPIIEIILDKFGEYGITEFLVSINHKAKMIKSYFEENNGKYHINYIEETEPLGTAGSLKLLEGRVQGPLLITNCDTIIESDYAEMLNFHKENKHDLTLIVSCRHYVIPFGVCRVEGGGLLKDMIEKPEYDFLVNTGMYLMNDNLLELIPQGEFFNITDLIARAQGAGRRIGVFPINESAWIDIGNWEEYRKAVEKMRID